MTMSPSSAATGALPLVRPKLPSYEVWASPLFALASTGAFALVVNLVRFGFAKDWLDPGGYVLTLLQPFLLTIPGYLVVRVALQRGELGEELARLSRALSRASLSVVCYAPVIWFYLLTSPTATRTFPTIAFTFGALAFWIPLALDLGRGAKERSARLLSIVWILLMTFAEAELLLGWLAAGIEGRLS